MELACYVMTRDYDEYATVREELLLRIMNFVEDSATKLASPSQTLYLSGGPTAAKQIIDKQIIDKEISDKQISDSRQGSGLKAPGENPKE